MVGLGRRPVQPKAGGAPVTVYSLWIPGQPVPKGRPKFRAAGAFVQAYTPAATRKAETALARAWQAQYPCLLYTSDDFGRSFADPELVRNLCFPRRSGITVKQVADSLSQMATMGIIRLYKSDGESFLYFPNWDKHQRIQQKRSKYPEPTDMSKEEPGSNNSKMCIRDRDRSTHEP